MANRKVAHYTGCVDELNNEAKVYRLTEWQVYEVRFYREGQENLAARYETPDLSDAVNTAVAWCGTQARTL